MNRRDFNLQAMKLAGAGGLAAWLGAGRRALSAAESGDLRLKGAYRFSRGRWIYVHLEGTPAEIGFQHGYLLGPEIEDAFKSVVLTNLRGTGKSRDFFRRASREMLWPRVDAEYQAEVEGIYRGLQARGAKMDLDDVIWLNAMEELSDYYVPWYDARHKTATN
ncbi:MAG TPA: peptidase C45, partial [Terriglobia bacterium]|nr:peptidase C45 [Terriglobia bacterium]